MKAIATTLAVSLMMSILPACAATQDAEFQKAARDYVDGLMKNVERAATRITNNLGAEITDSFVEYY